VQEYESKMTFEDVSPSESSNLSPRGGKNDNLFFKIKIKLSSASFEEIFLE
jgi:hypothetical protein